MRGSLRSPKVPAITFSGIRNPLRSGHTAADHWPRHLRSVPAYCVTLGMLNAIHHRKSAEFFEAEKHPASAFTSKSVKRTGTEEGTVTGNLTIHGVIRVVALQVEGQLRRTRIRGATREWDSRPALKSAVKKLALLQCGARSGWTLVGDDVTIMFRRSSYEGSRLSGGADWARRCPPEFVFSEQEMRTSTRATAAP